MDINSLIGTGLLLIIYFLLLYGFGNEPTVKERVIGALKFGIASLLIVFIIGFVLGMALGNIKIFV